MQGHSGSSYSLVLEHTDYIYHFLYGDMASMLAWLSTLPGYVRTGESLGFGSLSLRVVFNGNDTFHDEPIDNIVAYHGNVVWPQTENKIETS